MQLVASQRSIPTEIAFSRRACGSKRCTETESQGVGTQIALISEYWSGHNG
jgi:hypothetical protein